MIELLLPCGFDTLEYSWVKATIGIYTLVDYSVAKKCQQPRSEKMEPRPLYVCPGCSNHTYSNNMIRQMHCLIKQSNTSYIMTRRSKKDYIIAAKN
jgi:hypothetical protein